MHDPEAIASSGRAAKIPCERTSRLASGCGTALSFSFLELARGSPHESFRAPCCGALCIRLDIDRRGCGVSARQGRRRRHAGVDGRRQPVHGAGRLVGIRQGSGHDRDAAGGRLAHRVRRRRGRRRRKRRREGVGGVQGARWPLKLVDEQADDNGWSRRKTFQYQTSPNEKRGVVAGALFANGRWTVWIYDMADAVGEKRGAQIGLMFAACCRRATSARRSPAGRRTSSMPRASRSSRSSSRLGLEASACPASSLGLVQDGKVVFAGGFGVRELGRPDKVDGDTLYMIASNTKATDDAHAREARGRGPDRLEGSRHPHHAGLQARRRRNDRAGAGRAPGLRLHRAAAPGHGMDIRVRQLTPAASMELLATMQPTSELRRDVPVLERAGRGRRLRRGARRASRSIELGEAYDKAMQSRVFEPLGMSATTFDLRRRTEERQPRKPAQRRRRRRARGRGDGRQLRGHPGASRRRRAGAASTTC